MNNRPEPYFVAAECSPTECNDRDCPYAHFGGWAIDGALGLFDTPEEAIAFRRAALSVSDADR